MPKLLILQGIPASGKSTFAREWVNEDPSNRIIVNRDSIREMLGPYWMPSREELVTNIEDVVITNGLFQGYDVCVDATNLNPKTILKLKSYEDYIDCEIEFKHFKISLEEAIERDKNRSRSVGEKVIRDFYKKYYESGESKT